MTTYDPRRAAPGERFEWRDGQGEVHHLVADDDGVARPRTEGQKLTADAFDLPVARSAKKAEKQAADTPAMIEQPAEPEGTEG